MNRSILPIAAACVLLLPLGLQSLSRAFSSAPSPVGNSVSIAPQTNGPQFRDIAEAAGIHYQWSLDGRDGLDILQMVGAGCALLDYDNDGNLDVLLIGPKLALYKGDGHGHFTDVTHATGLDALHGHFLGCAVGDFDNDGYPDIYLTAYRGGALLHNEHGRRFTDVTRRMGLTPQPFATSAAFVDMDGDGRLDLFICNYVVFAPDKLSINKNIDVRLSDPEYGSLWHNEGTRFRNITRERGIAGPRVGGKALAVAAADYDGSGHQSLVVANDQEPTDLIVHAGSRLKSIGKKMGIAYGNPGELNGIIAGMGVDWGDYDNDGRLDLILSALRGDGCDLFHNSAGRAFENKSQDSGVLEATLPHVAWGVKFLDYDNDGLLDLIIANGHINNHSPDLRDEETFRQSALLLRNTGGGHFEDVSAEAGDVNRPILGRGLAIGDFDNDGKMDVLIVDADGRPLLLHNETQNVGHWLLCKLVGTQSNRDGIGAMLTFQTPDGRKLLRHCHTDGSYLSASEKRVHVGLGGATKVTITVRWPSGAVDTYRDVSVDRIVTLTEGSAR